jgi:hypothetical protein
VALQTTSGQEGLTHSDSKDQNYPKFLAKKETMHSFTPVKLSSFTLKKAAEIQERIEHLQAELDGLLQTGEETSPAPVAAAAATPTVSRGRGRKGAAVASGGRGRGRRSTSPTGPLAPAVVKVLKSRSSPMSVSEILDGLLSNGYKFASPEPKKNLFARIYRLKGVTQVGPGKFAAE